MAGCVTLFFSTLCGVNVGISLQGKKKLLLYYCPFIKIYVCADTDNAIYFVCKCARKCKSKCLLLFASAIVAKIRVFSPSQINLHLKAILQKVDGSLVYFGQMQRSISELLPVIKGTDDVEQIHGPCPISLHFTRHPSSQP